MGNYNKIIIKHIAFYTIAFMICMAITSCEKTGGCIIVSPNLNANTQIAYRESKSKVNIDSIHNVANEKHKEIDLKEHRVYYVDYSYSMTQGKNEDVEIRRGEKTKKTGKTLLALVKDSLKQSIRNIKGENVCIEIIPFLDNELWKNGKPTDVFRIEKGTNFEDSDLEKMDAFIDVIDTIRRPKNDGINAKHKPKNKGHYNTHHSIAINDFLNNRIGDITQYHTMILLTDGVDESHKNHLKKGAQILDEEWETKTRDKYVFGIFANLPSDTIKGDLPNRFLENSKYRKHRCYWQQGLNFDFNVFIIQPEASIEYRTRNIATIPIGGCIPAQIKLETQQDQYYRYTIKEQPNPDSKWINIEVESIDSADKRPNKHEASLSLKYVFEAKDNTKSIDIQSGNTVKLTIIDEKTPNIKLVLPDNKKDLIPCVKVKMNYCKKLAGIDPEWSDTLTVHIPYEKSDDAKFNKGCNSVKLSITEVPGYVELLTPKELYLDKPADTLSIMFALKPSHEDLREDSRFRGQFRVENADLLKAIIVNGVPLKNIVASNVIGEYEVVTNECWHPLFIYLLWLLISLLTLYIIYQLIIRLLLRCKPKFSHKIPAIQFRTDPDAANKNINPYNYFGFMQSGHLGENIEYIRFDTTVRDVVKKTGCIYNPFHICQVLKGNSYIYPIDTNIFAESIELRPTKEGISVLVDRKYKCTIETLGDYKEISTKWENGELYKLSVAGVKPTVINIDNINNLSIN